MFSFLPPPGLVIPSSCRIPNFFTLVAFSQPRLGRLFSHRRSELLFARRLWRILGRRPATRDLWRPGPHFALLADASNFRTLPSGVQHFHSRRALTVSPFMSRFYQASLSQALDFPGHTAPSRGQGRFGTTGFVSTREPFFCGPLTFRCGFLPTTIAKGFFSRGFDAPRRITGYYEKLHFQSVGDPLPGTEPSLKLFLPPAALYVAPTQPRRPAPVRFLHKPVSPRIVANTQTVRHYFPDGMSGRYTALTCFSAPCSGSSLTSKGYYHDPGFFAL